MEVCFCTPLFLASLQAKDVEGWRQFVNKIVNIIKHAYWLGSGFRLLKHAN
jgi:hypothetical protein